METIVLNGYGTNIAPYDAIELGTYDSYGIEQLQIVKGSLWEDLSIIASFFPPSGAEPIKVAVLSSDGVIDVPPEATAKQSGRGVIVFIGYKTNTQMISTNVAYKIKDHKDITLGDPVSPTPSVVDQIMKAANNAVDVAQSVRNDADQGKFNGKDGAKGDKGDTGTTPQLKIGEDNLWHVSYDNGETWVSLGVKATGDTGAAGKDGVDGLTPYIGKYSHWWIGNTDTGILAKGVKGDTGDKGADGVSPTAAVTQTDDGAKLTVTDVNGTTTATIKNGINGEDGAPGANGVSPTVQVETIDGGHRVILTDASDSHVVDVLDGKPGKDAIVDATLTQDGQAADAKVTGEEIGKLKEDKVDKPSVSDDGKIPRAKEGGVEWVEVGQPTDEQTDSAVAKWLTEHPEATTTVQDGVITEVKIAAEFLPYISNSYITPQMFGAKGDGVSDDTESIASCFAYARTKKSIIVFPAGNYGISEPLSVNFDIKIIGENAFIIPLKEMTHFMGINTSEKTNSGYIFGLGFSAGDTFSVSTGIKISYVANFRLHGLKIFNTTVGIDYIKGYELLVDSCLIRTNIPSTESIGIDVKTSDSHFSNIIIINYHMGIYDRNGGNFYDKIHAWIANSDIVKGSIYFFANGSAYLSQCFNDTYETAIYINGKQNVIVSGLKNSYNSNYINSDVIDDVPVLFYVSTGEKDQNLRCFGVSAQDVGSLFNGKKIRFSNVEKEKWDIDYKSLCPDSLSVYCDGVPDGLIVYNPGVTVATSSEASLWDIKYNRIYRRGRHCKLEFAALYSGTATNLSNVFNFASQRTRPANAKESLAYLSKGQYDIPDAFAYLYIGGGSLSLKFPDSTSKFIHFDVEYYAN